MRKLWQILLFALRHVTYYESHTFKVTIWWQVQLWAVTITCDENSSITPKRNAVPYGRNELLFLMLAILPEISLNTCALITSLFPCLSSLTPSYLSFSPSLFLYPHLFSHVEERFHVLLCNLKICDLVPACSPFKRPLCSHWTVMLGSDES